MAADLTLVALCGLPDPLHGVVGAELESRTRVRIPRKGNEQFAKTLRVMSLPAPREFLSYPRQQVQNFVQTIARATLRAREESEFFRPKRLLLLFVPSADESVLLEEFGIAPLPLRVQLDERERRFDAGVIGRRCLDAVERARGGGGHIGEVQQAVRSRRSVLLLPQRNFIDVSNTAIGRLLREVQLGDSTINRVEQSVRFKRVGKKSIALDARNRVFPPDPQGHAPVRDAALLPKLEQNASSTQARRALERLYRMGFPLDDGFHHDVARADGSVFRSDRFDCCEQGEILVSGTHANVYPDDFVRQV